MWFNIINSYESPIGASPSRNLDHSRPYEDELFDRSMSYRGSVGRAIGNATSYNGELIDFFDFLCCEFYDLKIKQLAIHTNSYRSPPKVGSGYKHSTLPSSIRNGYSSVSFLVCK